MPQLKRALGNLDLDKEDRGGKRLAWKKNPALTKPIRNRGFDALLKRSLTPPSELVSQTVSKIRNIKVFYFKCPGARCSKMRASRTAKPSCRLGPSRLPKRKSRARRARSLLPSTTMTWHPAGFRKRHGRTLRSRTKGSTDLQ